MKQFYYTLLFLVFNLCMTAQTGTSTEVGITEGQLSVSLTGGASYAIPIAVPPGINGVVPQVSLAYNSQGGNGLAGYGWNISGVSTISKIPATKFHDSTIDAVDFNSLDRFAFDGQRLVVKNGTSGVYGASGTVYETENFSTVQITSYGVHPSGAAYGPAYFIVEYPDGSKAYYGNSSDSRTITDYAITYWENPQGVRISYVYNNANNSLSIANINYGTLGAATSINKIQFNYDTAIRPEQAYIGGQSVVQNKILNNITVTGNSIGFRSYWLVYETTSLNYQRLIRITEKSGDGTKSYNPTVFSYDTTIVGISNSTTTANLSLQYISSTNSATVTGDFNGDGKMDFLLYPTTGTDAKKKYWLFENIGEGLSTGTQHDVGAFEDIFATSWLSTNNKLVPMQGWCVIKVNSTTNETSFNNYSTGIPIYSQGSKVYTFPKLIYYSERPGCRGGTPIMNQENIPKQNLSGDFNGDGLTDVIVVEKNVSYSYDGPCDVDGQAVTYNKTYVGKSYFVNLDRRVATNYVNVAGVLNANGSDKIDVADVNGDGKSDILVFSNGKVNVYTLNDSSQLIMLWSYSNVYISTLSNKPILIGDYNGDGKADFLIPEAINSALWHKYTSTGTTYVEQVNSLNGFSYTLGDATTDRYYIATDFNNDGKTDLLQLNAGGTVSKNVRCLLNLSNSFTNGTGSVVISESSNNFLSKGALPIFLPSNDDNGNIEIAFMFDHQIQYIQSTKNFSKERLLKEITTGNGVKELITYQPLDKKSKDDYIYLDSAYTENYPNFDVLFAPTLQVVSKLEKQSVSFYKRQLFSYYGAVSNVEGLGFLGFRSTARTNWHDDTNPIITSISKFDVSLRGANTENYSVLGLQNANGSATPSNFISKTTSTYTSSLGTNKVFNLKTTSSQQYNGLDDTSSETTAIAYDTNNNPLTSTTYLKNGNTTQQTTITNMAYASPTSSPYVVGRPINKTQSVTASGDTMTSEEKYTYNTGGLLTKIEKKGHNTNFITEDNDYDSFGNITKKTISATGLTPRVTNYEYDPSGRFLTKSIDVEVLATAYSYNTANGLLNSETNPYGLTTSYLYDSWFKKTKTTDYSGKSNTYSYTRNTEKTKITVTGDDGSYSEELYDDLGRKITASVKDLNGNTSSVSYLYDIYDRNYKLSEPYNGGSPSQWNETQYDVYGRTTQNISFTGKTTSISYSGLTTTVNDGTKTKIATKNAIGNMVSMTDTPGGTITYTYFANGNLKSSNYDGVVTTIEQNGWGRKNKLTDPSAGTYTYTYNDLGEALTETTPNGTTTYTLNAVGKPTQKTIVGTNTNSTTTYNYDSTTKLLLSSVFVDGQENNATTTTSYTYDSSKRLASSIETTPYASFTKQLTYDAFGRLNTETSIASAAGKSSTKTVQRTYKNGQPWQMIDTANSQVLWQTNTVNAKGQLTGATMANGNIAVSNTYDSYGLISQTKQDRLIVNPANIMTLNTVFDPQKGNLTSRTNSLFNWNESFIYDSLDRLTSFKNTAGVTETQSYDDRGRITQNAVGTYNYTNTAKAYQNTSVTVTPEAKTYYTAKPEQNITYNAFKSPYQIEEVGKDKISFTYNDNNSRSTIFYGGTGLKETRQYRKYYSADGSMEIKHNIATGAVEFVTYIGGDGYTAPLVIKSDGNTQNYLYLQRDYQGSIVAISDASGQVLEKRLFDAWGNVLVQDGAGNILNGLTILDRGYTGHEHLQSVGLIHMNGRLYDAKLHRFLQPDNYVQDPSNTQNYNRYGYVLNNPLKYTDWTGEKWKIKLTWSDLFAGVSILAGTALAVFGGPAGQILGAKLIGAGVTHFGVALARYSSNGGSWTEASNYAGFSSPTISINTGWGDSKTDTNGVNQNEPVVKPKSDVDGGGKNSSNNHNWENGDGYITVEEAVHTWQYGGGKQNPYADITKLDLSKVHVSDFPKGEGSTIWVNFASKKYYTNPTQAIVYGNISLTLMEGNKVFVPYQDKYDFDIRGTFSSIKRDVLTVWGNMYNSFGTPYYITINGVTTIKP